MQKVWECKIGEVDVRKLPQGSDLPMREAIAFEYERLTGEEPDFVFSGWAAELTEGERAAHEDRMPNLNVQIREAEEQLAMLYRVKGIANRPRGPVGWLWRKLTGRG